MNENCDLCNGNFNENDPHHTNCNQCLNNESFICDKCGKGFSTEKMLVFHNQMHIAESKIQPAEELLIGRDLLYEEVIKQQGLPPAITKTLPAKPRRIYKQPSNRIGLTKIRLEDCLRCDACSCIYIDQQDYYKHMKNFHEKYNTIIPRIRKPDPYLKKERSNEILPLSQLAKIKGLLQAQESNGQKPSEDQSPVNSSPSQASPEPSELVINKDIIKNSIKSRWSRVSQRLTQQLPVAETQIQIKQELADEEMSHLLSQVEVKIKTEPPDYDYSDMS